MSELFTQNYSDKPLFHTDTDISESLHNQVDEASNGEELLDNTEKQAESLLSNDDYVSETKDVISDDSEDVAESLSPPADGNRKYITGTNTPRASRSNAYYELLRDQQTNGHRSPAMRGTTAAAHGITSAGGLVSYQEDFATDAAQDLGVHGAAAELIMQETFLGTAAEDVGMPSGNVTAWPYWFKPFSTTRTASVSLGPLPRVTSTERSCSSAGTSTKDIAISPYPAAWQGGASAMTNGTKNKIARTLFIKASLKSGIYYCNAAVQYDALNDWPLREVDGTTFLQVEAGGQYELQYEFAGESWFTEVTGQTRYYTPQPLRQPPADYQPITAQVSSYLTAQCLTRKRPRYFQA